MLCWHIRLRRGAQKVADKGIFGNRATSSTHKGGKTRSIAL